MADRPPNRGSSLQRSADRREPSRPSIPFNPEDDLGLESLGVSDGFAPRSSAGHDRSTAPSALPSDRLSARRSVPLNAPPNATTQRSSTAKVSDQQDGRSSFALRNDGFASQLPPRRTPSTTTTLSNDTTSTFTISRTQSPFQGPLRPTHPYAMYPQGTGIPSPAMSLSTTSTVRLPEQALGVHGPTHPYTMYPQNTVVGGGSASDTVPTLSIPVGFPGLGQNYQRRLGPEGEEAGDIIGPDGHTEQLPPYSRYPDGIPTRGHVVSNSNGPGIPATVSGVPEYDPSRSQVSLNMPQSRLSIRSAMSDSSGTRLHAVGNAESGTSGSLKERLTETGRKRVFGSKIPLWCIAIVLVVVILLLGGIIGGVLARHHAQERLATLHPAQQSTVFATVTTTLDASPFPTLPSYVPSLPTGTWSVSADMHESSNECLGGSSDSNAWSCGPSSNLQNLQIEVERDSDGGLGWIRLIVPDRSRSLEYGAQPPVFNTPTEATVALDKNDPERGPAYFFHLVYDKVVLLHDNELGPSSSNQDASKRDIGDHKRDSEDDEPSDLPPNFYQGGYQGISRKNTAQPGDLLWVCVWNDTLLEGFVYITQHSANSSLASPTSSVAPSASRAPSAQMMTYPYVVKIEEHRIPALPSQPQPYCQKKKVLDNGSLGNWTNSTGGLIIEMLDECKPWLSSRSLIKERGLGRPRLEGRDDDYPTCRCEWMSL
ncbi:hypothetical protein FGG08_004120 [Glutinoglossum americanum]|uniref:DUF7820 domain-containing protein n=1 Tax=Glutinoglossum americanum TaxID=1670608 RepID=A0A9P8KZX6_9PEZI|nr:hypothetical protein FGG08_004120 [Glutinoglossum americanum]